MHPIEIITRVEKGKRLILMVIWGPISYKIKCQQDARDRGLGCTVPPFTHGQLSLYISHYYLTMPKRTLTRRSIKNMHDSETIPKRTSARLFYTTTLTFEIFSMACTDDGATGHPLSTIKKRIREVSKVFKYQTFIVMQYQLRSLALVLRSLPLNTRRDVHPLIKYPIGNKVLVLAWSMIASLIQIKA